MKKILAILIIGFLFTACQKEFPVKSTETPEMAREWYVKAKDGNTDLDVYRKIITYNSVENQNTLLWVDGSAQSVPSSFKFKSGINYTAKTFTAGTYVDDLGGVDVTVVSGVVILDGGASKTGVVTDSISLVLSFAGDPMEYTFQGHSRTGFLEDEY